MDGHVALINLNASISISSKTGYPMLLVFLELHITSKMLQNFWETFYDIYIMWF